jgi:hypothetical protein
VFGDRVSDRVRLEGSTFGTTPFGDGATPTPVTACS